MAWASMAQRLAHEIKTPLSTVRLSAQRLQIDFQGGQYTEDQNRNVDRIIRQVARLQKMTNAFLKFAHIQKPQLESICIHSIIDDCLSEMRLQMGSEIRLVKEFGELTPNVMGDAEQLRILFENLFSNAVNAMDGKGVLTISTTLAQSLYSENGNGCHSVQVQVSDTGKGIGEEDLEHLFQPFFSRSETGTGMGLVIIKRIVEDHDGEIVMDGKYDEIDIFDFFKIFNNLFS